MHTFPPQSPLLSVILAATLVLSACAPASPPAAPPTPRPPVALAPTPVVPPVVATPTPIPRGATPTPPATPSASDRARYGGVLTIGHFAAPPHFDIYQISTAATLWPLGPVYSGVLQYDPKENVKIIPDLAERWEVSSDAKVFTFFLRKGVTWHDGARFTAEDVVFAFNRRRNPPSGIVSPHRSQLANIAKIEKLDDYTVRFTLAEPQASFLPIIAQGWMPVMPKHVIESKGDMKNDVVGTGPFKFKRYQTGVAVELERNPAYYVQGRPFLNGITYFILTDLNTRFAALRAKRILKTVPAVGITADMYTTISKEMPDKINAWTHPYFGFIYLVMNVKMKPFDDPRVRKAVNLAMDRKAAIEALQQGAGTGGYMMPPGTNGALSPEEIAKMPGYREPKDQDVAEAKRLLAEAGYPNGVDTSMLNRAGPLFAPRGVFVGQQLNKIGIRARIDTKEDTSFFAGYYGREYPSVTYGESESVGDPDIYLRQYFHSQGGKNYSGFSNAEIDRLLDRQSALLDMNERAKIAQEIQRKLLADHNPVAHVVHPVGLMAGWKDVQGYVPPVGLTNNLQYMDVWLAK